MSDAEGNGTRSCVVAPGEMAPSFAALAECKSTGRKLLLFYPLAFAPVCREDLAQMDEALRAEDADGVSDLEVLAVSVDSMQQAHRFFDQLGLKTLQPVADSDLAIAAAYGVRREEGFAERASVLVDGEGRVVQSLVHDLCFPRPVQVLRQWVAAGSR